MDFGALHEPLDENELDELDAFLRSDALVERSMDISGLNGFLTAVISGPMVAPSEWLPRVWGGDFEFETADQAKRVTTLVMRMHNEVAGWLSQEPETFEPLFYEDKATDPPTPMAESWCGGYVRGMHLRDEAWQWLRDDPDTSKFLYPISVFALWDDPAAKRIIEQKNVAGELTNLVAPCAVALYARWRKKQAEDTRGIRRAKPKISPNAPCPCGSKKKYKRCCDSPLRSA